MALRTDNQEHAAARKGRGAAINPEGRFEQIAREVVNDGWDTSQGNAGRVEESSSETSLENETSCVWPHIARVVPVLD